MALDQQLQSPSWAGLCLSLLQAVDIDFGCAWHHHLTEPIGRLVCLGLEILLMPSPHQISGLPIVCGGIGGIANNCNNYYCLPTSTSLSLKIIFIQTNKDILHPRMLWE